MFMFKVFCEQDVKVSNSVKIVSKKSQALNILEFKISNIKIFGCMKCPKILPCESFGF